MWLQDCSQLCLEHVLMQLVYIFMTKAGTAEPNTGLLPQAYVQLKPSLGEWSTYLPLMKTLVSGAPICP